MECQTKDYWRSTQHMLLLLLQVFLSLVLYPYHSQFHQSINHQIDYLQSQFLFQINIKRKRKRQGLGRAKGSRTSKHLSGLPHQEKGLEPIQHLPSFRYYQLRLLSRPIMNLNPQLPSQQLAILLQHLPSL